MPTVAFRTHPRRRDRRLNRIENCCCPPDWVCRLGRIGYLIRLRCTDPSQLERAPSMSSPSPVTDAPVPQEEGGDARRVAGWLAGRRGARPGRAAGRAGSARRRNPRSADRARRGDRARRALRQAGGVPAGARGCDHAPFAGAATRRTAAADAGAHLARAAGRHHGDAGRRSPSRCATRSADAGYTQLAREHFGALTPLRAHRSPAQAIGEVSAGAALGRRAAVAVGDRARATPGGPRCCTRTSRASTSSPACRSGRRGRRARPASRRWWSPRSPPDRQRARPVVARAGTARTRSAGRG